MRTNRTWWRVYASAGAVVLAAAAAQAAPIDGGSLSPTAVPKFEQPLTVMPVMPKTASAFGVDYYEVAARQFTQQVLPPKDKWGNKLPPTTVWSYGSVNHSGSFHYPSFTFEAKYGRPAVVKWMNQLEEGGVPLQHLLPVDPTIHWANPIGMRDMKPPMDPNDPNTAEYWASPWLDPATRAYKGPVPIIPHLHGMESAQEDDGYPEQWFLPASAVGLAGINWTTGTFYKEFKGTSPLGFLWGPGKAVFSYPNKQRATTLWVHDHTIGMTRLNVYAGLGGFYLLRGGPDDVVRDSRPGYSGKLPSGTRELGLAIQDRSFNKNGSLFYPENRAFFEAVGVDELQIPFAPDETLNPAPANISDISPIWNPEFFGNMIVVNGKTWPYHNVEKARYRIRVLNGCGSRFLLLKFDDSRVKMAQIGADGGFLPEPVAIPNDLQPAVLVGPAERVDLIVDFSAVPAGVNVKLLNLGPDEPFGGGTPYYGCATDPSAPAGCFEPSDKNTTGQIMQFRVRKATSGDPSTPVAYLKLPQRDPLSDEIATTRRITLNEKMSMTVCVPADTEGNFIVPITEVPCGTPGSVEFGPQSALLGVFEADGETPKPLEFQDMISELPAAGTTEIWEIWNFTEDAHPIHIHLVQFEVLGRNVQGDPSALSAAGSNDPLPGETGTKDTVIAYPGEVTRVKATFTRPGLYVWHCHILEHEDNEMMRPYCVTEDGMLNSACQLANEGMPHEPM